MEDERNEFDKEIMNEFPTLFPVNENTKRNTVMLYGLECDAGWNSIIKETLSKLSYFPIIIAQIKQKFGGLRIYWEPNKDVHGEKEDFDKVREIIFEADKKASNTCEWCGKPGSTKGSKNWIRVLCPECRENEEKIKEERMEAYHKKIKEERLQREAAKNE